MTATKLKSRIIFTSVVFTLSLLLVLVIPRLLRPKDRVPKIYYTFEKGGIVSFTDSGEFLASLEVAPAAILPARSHKLTAVGQIVLLIEPASVTTGGKPHELHLDEKYSERLGLKKLPLVTGYAFGVSQLPTEYKLRAGLPVELTRYGLLASASRGVVQRILPGENNTQLAIFVIPGGSDWYPGTNCRIVFPTFSEKPVAIPKRALLHLGDKDYVFVRIAPEKFQLKTVTVFDETEQTLAVSGLRKGDQVLAKGSVLLKNFIPELLRLQN